MMEEFCVETGNIHRDRQKIMLILASVAFLHMACQLLIGQSLVFFTQEQTKI